MRPGVRWVYSVSLDIFREFRRTRIFARLGMTVHGVLRAGGEARPRRDRLPRNQWTGAPDPDASRRRNQPTTGSYTRVGAAIIPRRPTTSASRRCSSMAGNWEACAC
jgi:hypothetical protein